MGGTPHRREYGRVLGERHRAGVLKPEVLVHRHVREAARFEVGGQALDVDVPQALAQQRGTDARALVARINADGEQVPVRSFGWTLAVASTMVLKRPTRRPDAQSKPESTINCCRMDVWAFVRGGSHSAAPTMRPPSVVATRAPPRAYTWRRKTVRNIRRNRRRRRLAGSGNSQTIGGSCSKASAGTRLSFRASAFTAGRTTIGEIPTSLDPRRPTAIRELLRSNAPA